METKVRLPEELSKIIVELGFEGNSDFIEEAVRSKILELKRQKFFHISDKISHGLNSSKVGQKEVMDDFEKHRE